MGLQDATDRRPVAPVLLGEGVDGAASSVFSDHREFLFGRESSLPLFDRTPDVAVVAPGPHYGDGLDARVALGNVVSQLDPFVRVSFREVHQNKLIIIMKNVR